MKNCIVVNCPNKIDKNAATLEELWRPPSLSGATHMRGSRSQIGRQEHRLHSVCFCVGGLRAWCIDMCSNKDPGTSEPTGKQAKTKTRTKDTILDCKTQLEPHDMILYLFLVNLFGADKRKPKLLCTEKKKILMKLSDTIYTTVV